MKKGLILMLLLVILVAFSACNDASNGNGNGNNGETPVCEHVWGNWQRTAMPSFTEDGVETRICTRCNGSDTRPFALMVRIPAGEFTLGDNDNQSWGANPAHRVRLTRDFYMSRFEVTRAQWYEVKETRPWLDAGEPGNLPITHVTWFDAVAFANALSVAARLTPAYTITDRVPEIGHPITSATVEWNREADGYRLPTEAEWEYACRAGTTTPWYWADLHGRARFRGSPDNAPTSSPWMMEVGSFESNNWGLHDMHGNVNEWVWDWIGRYPTLPPIPPINVRTDPTGPINSTQNLWSNVTPGRVIRGGSFRTYERGARSAYRSHGNPNSSNAAVQNSIGFRVVRTVLGSE